MASSKLANWAGIAVVACLGGIGGYSAWVLTSAPPPAEPEIVRLMPTAPPPPSTDLIGHPAPAFELPDLDGETKRLSDWRGQTVLINFWATSCEPCREEMPMLEAVYQRYRDRGFEVLGIAIDDAGAIGEFIGEIGVTFPILVASSSNLQLGQRYGNTLGALPYSALVDAEGNIRYLKLGILKEADVIEAVEAAL